MSEFSRAVFAREQGAVAAALLLAIDPQRFPNIVSQRPLVGTGNVFDLHVF